MGHLVTLKMSERSHIIGNFQLKNWRIAALLALVLGFAAVSGAPAAERLAAGKTATDRGSGGFNLALPTLGGKQFWADRFFHAGWRIQRHVVTGHFRLLDPADRRRAWGSYEACRRTFEGLRLSEGILSSGRHLVILLHGLGRTKDSFAGLSRELRGAGYDVAAVSYPSTRQPLAAHADDLEAVLDSLEGVREVSFVTHSLGSFVLRELLSRGTAFESGVALRRAVLVGPPSQGADLADGLAGYAPANWIAGPALSELTSRNAVARPGLPIPFAVIAGGKGDDAGYNPLLEGDDDGVVRVAETHLAGAADFLRVPEIHTWIANHPDSVRATLNFLRRGHFADSPDVIGPSGGPAGG